MIYHCFTWQPQVEKTCRQVFRALHKIRLCGHFMSKNLKHRLVQSLLMPCVMYCDVINSDTSCKSRLRRASPWLAPLWGARTVAQHRSASQSPILVNDCLCWTFQNVFEVSRSFRKVTVDRVYRDEIKSGQINGTLTALL